MITPQSIDRLKLGLQAIVSESRSSLSVEDIDLLNDCIAFLDNLETVRGYSSPQAVVIVTRIVEILLRVLLSEDARHLKDLF